MPTKMRIFIEKILKEAPNNTQIQDGDVFSSTFNTAGNTEDLNLAGDLDAESEADNINVNTSFDDFDYESDFNTPNSSFSGSSFNFGSGNNSGVSGGAELPNAKVLIQTITDYFPDEGTVELTNANGAKSIKPISQVEL